MGYDIFVRPKKLLQLQILFLVLFPLTVLLNVSNDQKHGEIKQDQPGRPLYAVAFPLLVQVLRLFNTCVMLKLANSS